MNNDESSVSVALSELMQLEEERVEVERSAARRARARLALAAADARRCSEQEAKRAREHARAELERGRQETAAREATGEESLLRIQLEFESRQRSERQQRVLEHEAAMRRIEEARRPGRLVYGLGALLAACTVGGASLYFLQLQPALVRASVAADVAARKAEASEEELQELKALVQRRQDPVSSVPVQPAPPAEKVDANSRSEPKVVRSAHRKAPRRHPPRSVRRDALDDIDLDSKDPIEGLDLERRR